MEFKQIKWERAGSVLCCNFKLQHGMNNVPVLIWDKIKNVKSVAQYCSFDKEEEPVEEEASIVDTVVTDEVQEDDSDQDVSSFFGTKKKKKSNK